LKFSPPWTGDFIASGGTRGPDGRLRANEIRIFTAPGGEGQFPMAQPGQTMTNATVKEVMANAKGERCHEGHTRDLIFQPCRFTPRRLVDILVTVRGRSNRHTNPNPALPLTTAESMMPFNICLDSGRVNDCYLGTVSAEDFPPLPWSLLYSRRRRQPSGQARRRAHFR